MRDQDETQVGDQKRSPRGWRTGDAVSRLLIDVAAGRPYDSSRSLSDEALLLAHNHGLMGLMATGPPGPVKEAALPAFSRLKARQEVMVSHLRRILESFHDAGVRAAVLKGPDLAARTYRVPEHRTFTDVDVLLHPGDLSRGLEILSNDPAVPVIPPRGPKADKRNIFIADQSGVRFTLDLHWDLFSYTQLQGAARGATESAWELAEGPQDYGLGPSRQLPEAAAISFLCTHALLDHRFRLILFRDLAEEARQRVDWEELGRFVHRWSLRSSTYISLLMAARLTDAMVPEEFLKSLRPATTSMIVTERLLAKTDLVRFDGHRPHPLNLAVMLQHDSAVGRLRLAARAPAAFPKWRKRVGAGAPRTRQPATGSRKPYRVLHLLPADIARGAQTYAKALRDALDSVDVEHRTASLFRSHGNTLQPDFDLDAPVGFGSQVGFSPSALRRLRALLKSWKPDAVIAHGGESLKYAVFAAGPSTKLAYYKIGTARNLLDSAVRRSFHKTLVKRADFVAGVSNEMVLEAEQLLGARPDRTAWIPNGRDPSSFQSLASPGGSDPARLLFVGHLTRTKRPEKFIEVIDSLRSRGVEASGFLVGDGPLLDDLRRVGAEGVEFLGRRDDVPDILAQADVLLFTSLAEGEGMPGVLIEAGLAGLPVIATDVPGARTVVEDGVTGIIVPVHGDRVLFDAAERLARDPELRRLMGVAARTRCLERFTLESSVELWRDRLADFFREPPSG